MNPKNENINIKIPLSECQETKDGDRITISNGQVRKALTEVTNAPPHIVPALWRLLNMPGYLLLTELHIRLKTELKTLQISNTDFGTDTQTLHIPKEEIGEAQSWGSVTYSQRHMETEDETSLCEICNALSQILWLHENNYLSHQDDIDFLNEYFAKHPLRRTDLTDLKETARWLETHLEALTQHTTSKGKFDGEFRAPLILSLANLINSKSIPITVNIIDSTTNRVRSGVKKLFSAKAILAQVVLYLALYLGYTGLIESNPQPVPPQKPVAKSNTDAPVEQPNLPPELIEWNRYCRIIAREIDGAPLEHPTFDIWVTKTPIIPSERMRTPLFVLPSSFAGSKIAQRGTAQVHRVYHQINFEETDIQSRSSHDLKGKGKMPPYNISTTYLKDGSWFIKVSQHAEPLLNSVHGFHEAYLKPIDGSIIALVCKTPLGPVQVSIDMESGKYYTLDMTGEDPEPLEHSVPPLVNVPGRFASFTPDYPTVPGMTKFLSHLDELLPDILETALAPYQKTDWQEDALLTASYFNVNPNFFKSAREQNRLYTKLVDGVTVGIIRPPCDEQFNFPLVMEVSPSGFFIIRQYMNVGTTAYISHPLFIQDMRRKSFVDMSPSSFSNVFEEFADYCRNYVNHGAAASVEGALEVLEYKHHPRVGKVEILNADRKDIVMMDFRVEEKKSTKGVVGKLFLEDGNEIAYFTAQSKGEKAVVHLHYGSLTIYGSSNTHITVNADGKILITYFDPMKIDVVVEKRQINLSSNKFRETRSSADGLSVNDPIKIFLTALPDIIPMVNDLTGRTASASTMESDIISAIKFAPKINGRIANDFDPEVKELREEIDRDFVGRIPKELIHELNNGNLIVMASQGKLGMPERIVKLLRSFFRIDDYSKRKQQFLALYRGALNTYQSERETNPSASPKEINLAKDFMLMLHYIGKELLHFNIDPNTFVAFDSAEGLELEKNTSFLPISGEKMKEQFIAAAMEGIPLMQVGKSVKVVEMGNPRTTIMPTQTEQTTVVHFSHFATPAMLEKEYADQADRWASLLSRMKEAAPSSLQHSWVVGLEWAARCTTFTDEEPYSLGVIDFKGSYSAHPLSEKIKTFYLTERNISGITEKSINIVAYAIQEVGESIIPISLRIDKPKGFGYHLSVCNEKGEIKSFSCDIDHHEELRIQDIAKEIQRNFHKIAEHILPGEHE